MEINELLKTACDLKASDLHLTINSPPLVRKNGVLVALEYPKLTPADTAKFADAILDEKQKRQFREEGEIDLSYSIPQVSRFRINIFKQRGAVGLAIRIVPIEIKSIKELGLPKIVSDLARKNKGLVLITGPAGSGKSTTLAAMIDQINSETSKHIITIEDPIEHLHHHKNSIVNQREVGSDTKSFSSSLRAALRQDPDVILVGEMRDLETIAIAVTAAETGHLVLATLHTPDTIQAIDRIIDVFPPGQQQQIRVQLAATIQGIIAQQLIPRADGTGRILAVEILIATPAIRNLIREGKNYQIISSLQTGCKYGMQTIDSCLLSFYQKGLISYEEVVARTNNPETLNNLDFNF